MDIVTRPGFWNIPVWAIIAIYVLGLTACVICGLGIYKSIFYGKQASRLPWIQKLRDVGVLSKPKL